MLWIEFASVAIDIYIDMNYRAPKSIEAMGMQQQILIVDMDKCVGCKLCSVTCSLVNENVFSPARSRIRVYLDESSYLPIPVLCEHCSDPPCQPVCPTAAITKDTDTGIVKIDAGICSGCRACEGACPYDAVVFLAEGNKAVICDLCGGDPECAKVCTLGAIRYMKSNPSTIKDKWKFARERAKALADFRGSL